MQCHNPYFNRWFSAIQDLNLKSDTLDGHNPYFNRWFSAIYSIGNSKIGNDTVTILILIDGFLQYHKRDIEEVHIIVTILILIDGFLQYWESP